MPRLRMVRYCLSPCQVTMDAVTQYVMTAKPTFVTSRNICYAAASVPRFTPSSLVYQVLCVGSSLVIPVLFALLVSCRVLLPLKQVSAVQLRKRNNKPKT